MRHYGDRGMQNYEDKQELNAKIVTLEAERAADKQKIDILEKELAEEKQKNEGLQTERGDDKETIERYRSERDKAIHKVRAWELVNEELKEQLKSRGSVNR